ncbi:MAG: hypothetical protein WCE46_06530 [Methanoregula sp.]
MYSLSKIQTELPPSDGCGLRGHPAQHYWLHDNNTGGDSHRAAVWGHD